MSMNLCGRRALAAGWMVLSAAVISQPVAADSLSDKRLLPENYFFNPNTKGSPYLYGQINKGFLVHDDGQDTDFYPLVDNDNSSTRAGIKYEENWWPNVTVFGNIEGEWQPYASNVVNQLDKDHVDWDDANLRKFEGRVEVDGYGRLWVGQGSMASDGSAEKDLSGTTVIAYSSISDTAGGQFFAFDGMPGLSGVTIGDAFSNLDGLSRRMRVRYDSPSMLGARLSGSIGYDALGGNTAMEWDIAATFERDEDAEDFAIVGAMAYSRPGGEDDRFSASASTLHKPSGLSFTLAGGYDRNEGGGDESYIYGKIGYAPRLTDLGPTSFSLDGYLGQDFEMPGSESFSVGLAGVQRIPFADVAFDIYGVVRYYTYDDAAASYDDGVSFLTGLRWQF